MKKKEEIRKEFLAKRNRLVPEDIYSKSRVISGKLFSLQEFIRAETVMFYVSFQKEVRTDEMIIEALKDKRVAVPAVKGGGLAVFEVADYDGSFEKGSFGIPEPKEGHRKLVKQEVIDLVIVPGVVFDKHGGRIGFGKGYYDRFLKGLREINRNAHVIGLAFEMQVVEELKLEKNDVKMDKVITEKEIYSERSVKYE